MQTQACQLNPAIVISEWRAGVKLFAGEDPSSNGDGVVAVYQVRGITIRVPMMSLRPLWAQSERPSRGGRD